MHYQQCITSKLGSIYGIIMSIVQVLICKSLIKHVLEIARSIHWTKVRAYILTISFPLVHWKRNSLTTSFKVPINYCLTKVYGLYVDYEGGKR
jgi:hypothetical protein